jgi:hypothetical protein
VLPKPVHLLPSRYDQVGQLEREPGERRGCGEYCPAGFICRRCEEPGIEAASEYLLPPTATRLSSNGEDRECIQHLRLTDPRDDKKRIEETKGGLLEDSYHWILENSDFQQWRNDQQSRLLWIKGDPGKGWSLRHCWKSEFSSIQWYESSSRPPFNASSGTQRRMSSPAFPSSLESSRHSLLSSR